MLRESMQSEGKQVDVRGVTQGFDRDAGIPHADASVDFTEAVVLRDAGLVDGAAVVAAFHGLVRLGHAIGIPYSAAARGSDAPELRHQAGSDDFYRLRAER